MKTVKKLLAILLVLSFILSTTGCYFVSGQKMKTVKGTYKLTHYTYTPKYERKEGYTPRTRDYINDEEFKYEVYLVVTGTGTGYYVHKDANSTAYAKEITLAYEYSSEDSSKVEYITFNDSISVNATGGFNRLGVTKGNLNYTKSAFDYTELITKTPMRSEALSVRWEKVSDDTDLTYAKAHLGTLKIYDYTAYGVRGIYEVSDSWSLDGGEVQDNPYQYFFYVIDTSDGKLVATAYYALKDSPTKGEACNVSAERKADDWSIISLDNVIWTLNQQFKIGYYNETDGIRSELRRINNDISDASIDALIAGRIPAEQ